MAKSIEETLIDGIVELGLPLVDDQVKTLLAYLTFMGKWNRIYNLTAIRNPERMVVEHLLDALAVVPFLSDARRLLDVGTGGGIPGIPVAIVCPDIKIVLLDSNQKKTAFLTQMKIELDLKHVDIEARRVEDYHPPILFDRIISRAFASLIDFITATDQLLASDGCWLAMKGVYPEEEIAALSDNYRIEAVQRLLVPELEAQRHLLTIRRTFL